MLISAGAVYVLNQANRSITNNNTNTDDSSEFSVPIVYSPETVFEVYFEEIPEDQVGFRPRYAEVLKVPEVLPPSPGMQEHNSCRVAKFKSSFLLFFRETMYSHEMYLYT